MKKIIFSLAVVAAVGAVVVGATTAFFSDTETSEGNTFTAGTIDISVDGENPWTINWANYLDKPCQTNYMNFVIENVGENPANIWKRLTNVVNGPGDSVYPDNVTGVPPVASSEPEYEAGGGLTGTYEERDNLSAFMIYDMSICKVAESEVEETVCPMIVDIINQVNHERPNMSAPSNWEILINEADQVRVDNVVDTWIKLNDELLPGEKLVVSQSYHLMTWDDSGQPMITNWAQGDTMEFDVELDARQLTAPAPGTFQENQVVRATAELVQKDTTTWEPIVSGAEGTLTYDVAGDNFNYNFVASGLADQNYQLIYYPDPWANPKNIVLIGASFNGATASMPVTGNVDLGMDLPNSASGYDANYPVGAKVWLVPTSSLSGNTLSWTNINEFLFDLTLVNYDDLGI